MTISSAFEASCIFALILWTSSISLAQASVGVYQIYIEVAVDIRPSLVLLSTLTETAHRDENLRMREVDESNERSLCSLAHLG